MSTNDIEKVEVEVNGEKFVLKCPQGESDSYRRAARDVNIAIGEMQALTGNRLDLNKILSLVAINFCRDALAKDKEFEQKIKNSSEKFRKVVNQINAIGDDFS